MERKKSAIAVSFGDRLVYAVELLLLGSREANYRRIKRWILRCAEKQAEAWETSIEHFRKDHFDVRKLLEAPHMIAVALVGLDTTKLEQDWRFA